MSASQTEAPAFTDNEILGLPITLNSRQVSRIIGCTPQTVSRLAKEGQLPSKRIGHSYIFKRDEIFKLAGIKMEDVVRSTVERRLIEDKIRRELGFDLSEQKDVGGSAVAPAETVRAGGEQAEPSTEQLVSFLVKKLLS